MKSPFKFGKVVTGKAFIDRESELNRLISNYKNGTNTILISPRRWGKTSLITKCGKILEKKNPSIKFCFIDLFKIRDEEDFYSYFAKEIIKKSSSKWEEWVASAKEFFKSVVPRISLGPDPINDFEISFDGKNLDKDYEEILELPERIAKKKKLKFIICIDEFQNLSNFKQPSIFQKRLRSVWQHHNETAYCLYGSKRSMLLELFENQSNPFYKFGDLIFLSKIELDHWRKFITKSFKETGKTISDQLAVIIVEIANGHPYYVQQLAHLIWLNTKQKVSLKEINRAIEDLISQYEILYLREVDHLTTHQLNFLKALSNGEEKFNSAEVMNKYNLGSSSNVIRVKEALAKKEIIDILSPKIEFVDPAFQLWFSRNFK